MLVKESAGLFIANVRRSRVLRKTVIMDVQSDKVTRRRRRRAGTGCEKLKTTPNKTSC